MTDIRKELKDLYNTVQYYKDSWSVEEKIDKLKTLLNGVKKILTNNLKKEK